MHDLKYHDWNVSPSQATQIQQELKEKSILIDDYDTVNTVAGIDVGFDKASNQGRAAIVILQITDLEVLDTAVVDSPLNFPYIPGLLSFREVPAILKAFEKLTITPDLLLCDGQGIAHPRRFGIACHLGILTNIPAIGVAKTRLIGKHENLPQKKGSWVKLIDQGEVIGAVLRSRVNVKPLYVSPGHRISLESSIRFVMKCITQFKLPETTRKAHALSQLGM